jgi:predicted secreted Zn-dependent protease
MKARIVAGIALAGFLSSFVAATAVDAAPRFRTKYTYYTIKGQSAQEVYSAMIARGPHVNGAKAYASTSATSSQEGKLLPGKQCRVTDYKFKIDFVIRLPKLANEKVLKGETRKRWYAFSDFLRKHEETHRSIWLGCAQELENKVSAIRADDCDEVDQQAARLWDKIRAQCNLKHDAFDSAEQKRLAAHPFVKLVIRQTTKTTKAAAIGTSRKKRQRAAAIN